MLAEIRKYGESLIIVDQIPDKLTSEVLKNTNTKIVHRIFAQDDKEAIGNTMALSDEQKEFLSSLETGRAIVYTGGWSKALQVQIDKVTNTTGEKTVTEDIIRRNIMEFYRKSYKRAVFQGLEHFEHIPSLEELETVVNFINNGKLDKEYKNFFKSLKLKQSLVEVVKQVISKLGLEITSAYLTSKFRLDTETRNIEEIKEYVLDFLNHVLEENIDEIKAQYYEEKIRIKGD